MPKRPIVLIHGYSDEGKSFAAWRNVLQTHGYPQDKIRVCSYATLTNEVTIKDIAEGFERALRIQTGLRGDEEFDAIVHSTGMLVIRTWLASYAKRRSRLKHLIGLAPGNFGSPLAHKGQSWLGAIFKGNKNWQGPDFLEAGVEVLDALELGSSFTWDLAHRDLIGKHTYFGPDADTPYVFTFCGAKGLTGMSALANEPGMDGTVRWAGCALNTRKITIDLTIPPGRENSATQKKRFNFEKWCQQDIPLIPIKDNNHSTIMESPSDDLVAMVVEALAVDNKKDFTEWLKRAKAKTQRLDLDQWQQFIIRVIDERGDPVPDYHLRLFTLLDKVKLIRPFDLDVHAYSRDSSLRCFHVNLSKIELKKLKNLHLQVIAESGSDRVGYVGYGSEKLTAEDRSGDDGKWDAQIDISPLLTDAAVKFFYPFTTTLIEIKLNREPLPPEPSTDPNRICWFDSQELPG